MTCIHSWSSSRQKKKAQKQIWPRSMFTGRSTKWNVVFIMRISFRQMVAWQHQQAVEERYSLRFIFKDGDVNAWCKMQKCGPWCANASWENEGAVTYQNLTISHIYNCCPERQTQHFPRRIKKKGCQSDNVNCILFWNKNSQYFQYTRNSINSCFCFYSLCLWYKSALFEQLKPSTLMPDGDVCSVFF